MIFECFDWSASLLVGFVVEEESFADAGIFLSCNMTKIVFLLSFDILKDVFSLADA